MNFTHFALFFAYEFAAFRIVFCIWIWRISHCFLHVNFTHFALFFAYEFNAFRTVFCMFFHLRVGTLRPIRFRDHFVPRRVWRWGHPRSLAPIWRPRSRDLLKRLLAFLCCEKHAHAFCPSWFGFYSPPEGERWKNRWNFRADSAATRPPPGKTRIFIETKIIFPVHFPVRFCQTDQSKICLIFVDCKILTRFFRPHKIHTERFVCSFWDEFRYFQYPVKRYFPIFFLIFRLFFNSFSPFFA